MNITDIFIRRPVLASVVSILILVAGLQAIFNLTIRQYPRSDSSVINIQTIYVGAPADLVQGFVTTPIERAIASTDGIEYVESQSALGSSNINAHLKLNIDPVRAMAEISAKINQIRGDLPAEAEIPAISISRPDEQVAAAYLGFSSNELSQTQITDYLTRSVQPRLAALPGIQRADVLGAKNFAMRIWLKPKNMAAMGISPSDVQTALRENNVQAAIGQTRGALTRVNLSADTDLKSVDEFEKIIVRRNANGTVRLSDIADIELGSDNYGFETAMSGETAVFVGVWVLPTANSLEVIRGVRNAMASIQTALPAGLNARVAYDSTKFIEQSLDEVLFTLAETLAIITIVIFLFLGFSRSVLIPLLAIPLSLVGAIFVIQLFGFSINVLTLLAIVLSVGLVVDDAIIMVENIERHIEQGESPFSAALIAARELVGPIISMTITIVSVYIPIAFQGGLTGALFREFAVTLAGAIVISAVIALTLSPMLGAKLLKPHKHMAGPLEPIFEKLKRRYASFLNSSLQSRGAIYCFWIIVSLLTVPMYLQSMQELAPNEDRGVIFGIVETPSDATVDQSAFYAKQINDIYMSTPETDFTFQVTWGSGGFSGMVTKPWDERDKKISEILPTVQYQLGNVAGARSFAITPPALPGGSQFPVDFLLTSTAPPEEIFQFAQQLQFAAMQSGLFAFPPAIDMRIDQPSTELVINKEKVADLGLSLASVTRDLNILLSDNYTNRFSMQGFSYKVIPQVKRENRLTPEGLNDLYLNGPDNQLIRVAEIASLVNSIEPRSLNRFQQLNAVKISGKPSGNLDEALTFLEQKAAEILPKNYQLNYTGESRQLRNEGNKFIPAISFAILIIFLVLAAQFNSYRDPLIILLGSAPLALFGAMIFTYLKSPTPFWTDSWTTTLNIYSQVGLVTLIGLIVRNGILVVEFANKLQEQGKQKIEAIKEASLVRLRPVVMTSLATVAGHTPLIFAAGAGAEARNSIGIVLVLGMFIGSFFSLLVLPSIYMLIARDYQKATTLSHSSVSAE